MSDPYRSSQPSRDPSIVSRRLAVIAAGHRGDLEAALAATTDTDPSVRAAALAASARAGGWNTRLATAGASDHDDLVRTRSYELTSAGEVEVGLLAQGLAAKDPLCVVACCAALGRCGATAALDQLVAVARSHGDARCQEAAVAALGELGDPAGLPAVLEATEGKPAMRRRAAVALAGFDDPEVEAALDRLAEDRDWQVRDVVARLRREPIT